MSSQPSRLKSPERTAALIKKVSQMLGSSLTGITKLNPDWVYGHPIRGRRLGLHEGHTAGHQDERAPSD